jgi:hypothetical protein
VIVTEGKRTQNTRGRRQKAEGREDRKNASKKWSMELKPEAGPENSN